MPIVRIKYFPEEGTSSDVRRFFKRVDIADGGVHIIGGPKGFVYVRLQNAEDLVTALKRDGKKISPKECEFAFKVKVTEASEEEMSKAISDITGSFVDAKGPREVTPPPKNDVFVRLDDLAPSATLENIVQFFEGIRIAQVKQKDCGAFIKFKSVDDKQEALTYDQKFFGSRFIKVNHLCSDLWENLDAVPVKPSYPSENKKDDHDQGEDFDQEKQADPEVKIDSQCVMLSGVAPDVTKKDLVHELLKECRITKFGLYMETQDNRCTGKCYIEFVDQLTRDRAIKKAHNNKFRGNTVTLVAITATDMKSRVQQHRKSLKIMEYNHRKEAKAKAKKRKEDLSEREGKVEDELKERARLKEEMLKELEKTSTKPSSNSKSPKKTKKHPSPTKTASSTAIVSPSPKNTSTSSEDEGLSALFAPKGTAPMINSSAAIRPVAKIKMNLNTASNSKNHEEESVLKRLQQEQKANEEKSIKRELKKSSKKNEDADSTTNSMGLMLMSNIMTNMMSLQNSQTQKVAAFNPPPPPPLEPSDQFEPPALQNEYQQQAYLQLQSQNSQMPNKATPSDVVDAQNYTPNSQLYQPPRPMASSSHLRPPKAPRLRNPPMFQDNSQSYRSGPSRMPAPNSHFNPYNANLDENLTEMPIEGHLRSPQKSSSYHTPGSKRGEGTFGRGVPRGVRPQPFSASQTLTQSNNFPRDKERNYGAFGSPNYPGGNPTRGARSNRGFRNGHSPGSHNYRGSTRGRGAAYGAQPYQESRMGSSQKVRPNKNGYSGGQFYDQGFVPRNPGPRDGHHRAGFQQRGRSWMSGPRFP